MSLAEKIVSALFVFVSTTFASQAQQFSLSVSPGTGKSYMIEQLTYADHAHRNHYSLSKAIKGSLTYTKPYTYFSFGASFIYSHTEFTNRFNFCSPPMQMVSSSFYLNARHLKSNKKLNFGYGFALGITHEQNGYYSNSETFNNGRFTFVSFNTSGIASYNFAKRASLILEPTLIWADFNDTFKPDDWLFGREDLHFITHIGLECKFGKIDN